MHFSWSLWDKIHSPVKSLHVNNYAPEDLCQELSLPVCQGRGTGSPGHDFQRHPAPSVKRVFPAFPLLGGHTYFPENDEVLNSKETPLRELNPENKRKQFQFLGLGKTQNYFPSIARTKISLFLLSTLYIFYIYWAKDGALRNQQSSSKLILPDLPYRTIFKEQMWNFIIFFPCWIVWPFFDYFYH